MTTFKERDKWEEVNDLMTQKRWNVSPRWLKSFHEDPAAFQASLSYYKFAAKMCTHSKTVVEIGCGFGMGVPIAKEFSNHYTAVVDDPIENSYLEANLKDEMCDLIQPDQIESLTAKDVALLINPAQSDQVNQFIHIIEHKLCGDAKALCALYPSMSKALCQQLENKMRATFELVVPFFANGEIIQCGVAKEPEVILFLGMQKK